MFDWCQGELKGKWGNTLFHCDINRFGQVVKSGRSLLRKLLNARSSLGHPLKALDLVLTSSSCPKPQTYGGKCVEFLTRTRTGIRTI